MPVPRTPQNQRVQASDFALLKHPRALALSPDGALLAYTLQWCDYDRRKCFANLHLLNTAKGESRQWTFGEHTDRNPVWSADGKRLAFCRRDQGLDKLFIFARDGGEPTLVFKTLGSLGGIRWAEDDQALIVRFREADPDTDAEKAVAEGSEPEVKAPAVRKITRLAYRFDGEGFLPADRWHLCRLDLQTLAFESLTRGKADVTQFNVSPDGQCVAYVTNLHRDPDLHPFHEQILLLDLQTRRAKSVDVPFGEKHCVAFSPNGRYLVYLGHHNLHDCWGVEPVHPWLIDLKSGKSRNLTPGFDRQPGDHTIGDLGYGTGSPGVFWSADSRAIYYQITAEGDTYLARATLTSGAPERVGSNPGQVALLHAVGKRLALLDVGYNNLGEIHFCEDTNAKRVAFRSLAAFNRDYLAARAFGKIREVHFKSADRTRLHGWVWLPPDFNPRKKYPAILEVHGGPRTQYGRVFFHEMHYLAAQGYVVFTTNPRGSQGYGAEFAGAIAGNKWGTVDFDDIMAAADWLEAQPFVEQKAHRHHRRELWRLHDQPRRGPHTPLPRRRYPALRRRLEHLCRHFRHRLHRQLRVRQVLLGRPRRLREDVAADLCE